MHLCYSPKSNRSHQNYRILFNIEKSPFWACAILKAWRIVECILFNLVSTIFLLHALTKLGTVIAATTPIIPRVIRTSARVNASLERPVFRGFKRSPPPPKKFLSIIKFQHINLLNQKKYKISILDF